MTDCIFCKIASGEIPSQKLYEDDDVFVFLDNRPVNPGHTLVIPKKHSTNLLDMDETSWLAVTRIARKIALAIDTAITPTGINVNMNNKAGAGQVVFHSHVHVIPRVENDGLKHWPGNDIDKNIEDVIRKKITDALS